MNGDYLDKNYLRQLTNELYRLTLLFPKKEPLRNKIRDIAGDVLADFISLSQEKQNQNRVVFADNSSKKLKILDMFFDVAKSQNWVRVSDMLNLQKEYSKMREELIKLSLKITTEKAQERKEKQTKLSVQISELKEEEAVISERQEKILKLLRKKGRAQVWEVKEVFTDTSKRTLRRDFNDLLKRGLVDRIGEKNNTFYQINGGTLTSIAGRQ